MPTERPALVTLAGQPAMRLESADGAVAIVLLHGAHVVSWVPAGSRERLYLSPDARYGDGVAVRGGVPVIFPQFNELGPLPRHGFARTRAWRVVDGGTRDSRAFAVLRLVDDADTRAIWPHRFDLDLTVSVGGDALELELAVRNTGDDAFAFHAALHTYLRCDDATTARVDGLPGDAAIVLAGRPVDRLFADATAPLALVEAERRTDLSMRGFTDVVIWNPGPAGAATIADLPDADWRHLLCLEAARIAEPVRLAPGARWTGAQSLRA
jgi:glucose-6-phosphate 1-epimerase